MSYGFTSIGNCNVSYAGYIASYYPNMGQALADFFTGPANIYNKAQSRFILPSAGIILFAQGSEDSVVTKPYAQSLADLITKYGLGEVHASGAVPNSLHANKPGYLYMWILNKDAITKWYPKHVTPDGKFVIPAEELSDVCNPQKG